METFDRGKLHLTCVAWWLTVGDPCGRLSVQDLDVRTSDDAGHFCCDYIYYAGLFEYWKRYRSDATARPVMFLHVPGETDARHVEAGTRVAEGLIRACVTSWRTGKRGGNSDNGDDTRDTGSAEDVPQ